MHLHDDVSLEDLERRPQTVRLFCLLHADGVDITIARKVVFKAMKLSESQVTHNAANVKTARDFVKQLTNSDDRKKGRNSRASGKRYYPNHFKRTSLPSDSTPAFLSALKDLTARDSRVDAARARLSEAEKTLAARKAATQALLSVLPTPEELDAERYH